MLLPRFFPFLSPYFTGILSCHNQITSGICLKFSLKKLNSLYNGVCTPYPTAFPTLPTSHLRHTPFLISPFNLATKFSPWGFNCSPFPQSLNPASLSVALTLLWTVCPHGDLTSWCKQHRQMNIQPHKLMGRQGLAPHTKQCSCDTQNSFSTAPCSVLGLGRGLVGAGREDGNKVGI